MDERHATPRKKDLLPRHGDSDRRSEGLVIGTGEESVLFAERKSEMEVLFPNSLSVQRVRRGSGLMAYSDSAKECA